MSCAEDADEASDPPVDGRWEIPKALTKLLKILSQLWFMKEREDQPRFPISRVFRNLALLIARRNVGQQFNFLNQKNRLRLERVAIDHRSSVAGGRFRLESPAPSSGENLERLLPLRFRRVKRRTLSRHRIVG